MAASMLAKQSHRVIVAAALLILDENTYKK